MNLADQINLEDTIGRLRGMECAIQALILSHPNPEAFEATLNDLLSAVDARPELDGHDPHVQARAGFRESCAAFRRAAEVASSTRQGNGSD